MSKVFIEIEGVRYGLRISPAIALELVEALQGVWVSSSSGRLSDVRKAREGCQHVISRLTLGIFRSARGYVEGRAQSEWAQHVRQTCSLGD